MSNAKAVLVSSLAALLLSSGPSVAAAPVTSCGQTVSDGVLTGDLDCTAGENFAVTVTAGGRLDLAGFTLTGTADYGTNYETMNYSGGVLCLGSCTIVGGGGAIVGPSPAPAAYPWLSFGVYSDEGYFNRDARRNLVVLSDLTISNWRTAAVAGPRLEVSGLTCVDNFFGVGGGRKSTIDDSTFSGNTGDAIHFYEVTITNTSVTGNRAGLYALRKMTVRNSTVEGNDDFGFSGGKLKAEHSDFAGNCLAPLGECADLVVYYGGRRPRMTSSPCDTSLKDRDTLATWNVCALD